MLFAIHLLDKPAATDLRAQVRPDHRAYLAEAAERIAFAGPLLADDGATMAGSLLVMDFASREAVLAWLDAEPFTRAGLYASRSVYRFNNLYPQKVGFPPEA